MRSAREKFTELRNLPGTVVPHGHYRGEYPDDSREDCRQQLGIPSNAKVVLFFGWIRDYKNVPGLIAAFRGLSDSQAALCIAGREFSKSGGSRLHTSTRQTSVRQTSVRELTTGDSRIYLHLRHVPNEEVQTFFGAADLVALPYREILNSGTALLALSFNKPVLVPRKGAMSELQALVGSDWVRTYEGDLSTGELAGALQWAQKANRSGNAPLDTLDWNRVAEQTLDAYRNVLFPSAAGEEKVAGSNQESRSASASALHS